ncbi:HAD hydrolase family protein [Aceticella autotrophica]|uniref:HAD hydrolase family protein n=1 Tax=Aceticella autotrophica TaxID=2755338 RepID=A0A975AWG5_9THEO|nr:HAD hydrolase family protein [Aceticella autotrophica]QSZ27739.1 HAD hydrolase family protein [Aceticella autotrophica]
MIEFDIPGYKIIEIKNVVFDFNGTLAEDGILIEETKDKIRELSNKNINLYILTSDTYGSVKKQCSKLPVKIEIFDKENASQDKKRIVEKLGSENTLSIGNGKNDLEMFKSSRLSIAIIGREGCFSKALFEADIVVNNIIDAIDLLLKPDRIKATLRT